MIQITLGRHRLIDPREDAFGRSQIGWTEGLSDQQLHDIARGTWVMPGERVERERFAVVSGDVIIRQAMEIDRVVDTPDGRRAFEGRVLGPGHPVYDRYVGKPPRTAPSRTPSPTSSPHWTTGSATAAAANRSNAVTSSPDTTSEPSTRGSPASAP